MNDTPAWTVELLKFLKDVNRKRNNPYNDAIIYRAVYDAWKEKLATIANEKILEAIQAGIYESMPLAKDLLTIMREKQ